MGFRKPTAAVMIEVCRSFSFRKLNLGNYESADFFASRKMQCEQEAAPFVSQQIFEECVEDIREAVVQFKKMRREERAT